MGASRFVGRVGGLAVALGVGAAVFTGYGVAWADGTGTGAGPSSTGSAASDPSAGSEAKRSADGTGASARPAEASPSNEVVSSGGARSSSRSKGHSRADVVRSRVNSTPPPSADGPSDPRPASSTRAGNIAPSASAAAAAPGNDQSPGNHAQLAAPVVNAVAAVQAGALPAPGPAAAVSGFLTTVVNDLLKPFSGNNPVAPVDSPLALALVAFTRRESANAAAGSSTPSALPTTSLLAGNPLTINPQLTIVDGIINGAMNAVDSSGSPLVYTLVSTPSAGGKVTFAVTGDTGYAPGKFTYLPDQSVLATGNEQFKVLVAQNTPFDQFLISIPLVGSLVPPTLVFLHQAPILGDLLAPIIGYSQLATFDSNAVLPSTAPVAFTYKMPSFDGTLISVNWFPAANQWPAVTAAAAAAPTFPTILNGPGLAGAGQTDPYTPDGTNALVPSVQTLRNAGYNVVTWDPRGEFASGGILQLDNPFFEGRDVSSMVDWVSTLPTTKFDDPNDPLVGMVGGSYGGGIQLTSAATDPRIDAIVPGISWNSLNNSLYPNNAFKTSYASLLLLSLVQTGARINNQIYAGIVTGLLLGFIDETAQAVLASSGPTSLLNQLKAPTLLISGTVDVLFPLQQAIDNAQTITSNPFDTPVSMIWYCGGHGVCLTTPNTTGTRNVDATMAWLDHYIKGGSVPASPAFQYTDQYGGWYESSNLPTPGSAFYGTPYQAVTGASGGLLPVFPILGGSGPAPEASLPYSLGLASKASNAVNVAVPTQTGAQYVGAPTLSFDYQGLGTNRFVYAQLVDNKTGLVVGNLVTPIPVTMDGRPHTVSVPMEAIVYTVKDPNTDNLTLQITSSATAYENFTAVGVINISNVGLTLPTPATITPE